MNTAYVTYLRIATVAFVIGLSVMISVLGQIQEPSFAEDTVRITPGDCQKPAPTGHVRFNPCANLDTSRFEVRK